MIRPRIAGHPIFRASEARDSTGLQPRGGPVPKVGAVQYLNTRPLVHGLSEHRLDLCYDLPSRLADRLADGSLDVALIPTVELFRSPGHTIVSNACIGCLGPVMSVKLFFRVAPSSVTTLAVDEGSRTSAALSRILLAERYDVHPAVSVLPIGANLYDTNADAVLLIGDRALGPGPGSVGGGSVQVVWDLGDEWLKWTGLPFVFAVWAAREGVDATGLAASLESARDAGVANLAAIAAAEAAGHGLTVPQCLAYLRDNLHFHLGERERSGLSRFQAHAERLGLVPSRPTVNARSVGTITDRHTV